MLVHDLTLWILVGPSPYKDALAYDFLYLVQICLCVILCIYLFIQSWDSHHCFRYESRHLNLSITRIETDFILNDLTFTKIDGFMGTKKIRKTHLLFLWQESFTPSCLKPKKTEILSSETVLISLAPRECIWIIRPLILTENWTSPLLFWSGFDCLICLCTVGEKTPSKALGTPSGNTLINPNQTWHVCLCTNLC